MLMQSVTVIGYVNKSLNLVHYVKTVAILPTLFEYSRCLTYVVLIQSLTVLHYVNLVGMCPTLC